MTFNENLLEHLSYLMRENSFYNNKGINNDSIFKLLCLLEKELQNNNIDYKLLFLFLEKLDSYFVNKKEYFSGDLKLLNKIKNILKFESLKRTIDYVFSKTEDEAGSQDRYNSKGQIVSFTNKANILISCQSLYSENTKKYLYDKFLVNYQLNGKIIVKGGFHSHNFFFELINDEKLLEDFASELIFLFLDYNCSLYTDYRPEDYYRQNVLSILNKLKGKAVFKFSRFESFLCLISLYATKEDKKIFIESLNFEKTLTLIKRGRSVIRASTYKEMLSMKENAINIFDFNKDIEYNKVELGSFNFEDQLFLWKINEYKNIKQKKHISFFIDDLFHEGSLFIENNVFYINKNKKELLELEYLK